MRIAALPAEKWTRTAAEWNLDLSTKYQTYRVVPIKWEDVRTEGIEEETNNDERNNDTWIKTVKDQKGWKKMESSFAMTTTAAHDTRRQRRMRTEDSV